MSENEQAVNVDLPPHIEQQIQSRWLGLVQSEFGALQTNFFMMQARVEALNSQRSFDLRLIEGLKKRALEAESNMRQLQQQLLAERTLLEKAKQDLKVYKKRRACR